MYQVLDSDLEYTFHAVARCAVDRSAGCVVRLNLDCPCDYFTLNYIITRSKNLKHLQLGWYAGVSDRDLIEVATSLPMLEELHVRCPLSGTYIEPVGRSCCALKSFTLDHVEPTGWVRISDEEALAVGRSMPNLLHLQLIGNGMTNVGLKAILDGCPLLESLDLRGCLQIDLSGDLAENCKRIKNLCRPYDSTADYPTEDWIDFDSKLTGEDDDYGYF